MRRTRDRPAAVDSRIGGRRRRRDRSSGAARTGRVGAGRPPRCDPGRLPRRSRSDTAGCRVPGRAPRSRRHRRALPHRRNHGDAQAGGAHPREPGGRRMVPRRDLDARRRLGHLRRTAPLPRERARRHAARADASRPVDGVGGPRGLPRSRALPAVLAHRRALPRRRDECGPDHLRGARTVPGGCGHLQPASRDGRRVRIAARGAARLRGRHGRPTARGLRPHRGDLCERSRLRPRITARGRSVSGCRTSA